MYVCMYVCVCTNNNCSAREARITIVCEVSSPHPAAGVGPRTYVFPYIQHTSGDMTDLPSLSALPPVGCGTSSSGPPVGCGTSSSGPPVGVQHIYIQNICTYVIEAHTTDRIKNTSLFFQILRYFSVVTCVRIVCTDFITSQAYDGR
jgi:hypothetical protein